MECILKPAQRKVRGWTWSLTALPRGLPVPHYSSAQAATGHTQPMAPARAMGGTGKQVFHRTGTSPKGLRARAWSRGRREPFL